MYFVINIFINSQYYGVMTMEYEISGKGGKIKRYEISYSQVLQKQTNNLLIGLIVLLLVLLLIIGFTLYKIDALDIPTRVIYGG